MHKDGLSKLPNTFKYSWEDKELVQCSSTDNENLIVPPACEVLTDGHLTPVTFFPGTIVTQRPPNDAEATTKTTQYIQSPKEPISFPSNRTRDGQVVLLMPPAVCQD